MGCGTMAICVATGHYWWQHWMRTSWVEDLSLPPRQVPFALAWWTNRLGTLETAVGQLYLASSSSKQPLSLLHQGTYWENKTEIIVSHVAVCSPSCCCDGNLNAHLKSTLTQCPRVWGCRDHVVLCQAARLEISMAVSNGKYLVWGEINAGVVWQVQLNKGSS